MHSEMNPRYCPNVRMLGNTYVLTDLNDKRIILALGPHYAGVAVTLTLLWTGSYVSNYVIEDNRNWTHNNKTIARTICWILAVVATILLLMTALVDQGIVFNGSADRIKLTKNVEYGDRRGDDEEDETWYCDHCSHHVPLDMDIQHCHMCGVCMEGLDHHCPWMGKCVAKGNFWYFIGFNVAWMVALALLLLAVFL
jgi:DHHC palmitoyltransferase